MATPDNITIGNLNNTWVLQGVSWIIRKTVPAITITIKIHEYPSLDPESDETIINLDLTQIFSGGFPGTKEKRTLDWIPRGHSDYIFGSVHLQARCIYGQVDESGVVRPMVPLEPEMCHEEEIHAWLMGISPMNGQSSGFLADSSNKWIYTVERKVGGEGLSAQVWGFEMIDEIRHLSRRIVVMNSEGKFICGRLVYDFCE